MKRLQMLIEGNDSVESIINQLYEEQALESDIEALKTRIKAEEIALDKALSTAFQNPDLWIKLYSAKQALAWVLKPHIAASPFEAIEAGQVMSPTSHKSH